MLKKTKQKQLGMEKSWGFLQSLQLHLLSLLLVDGYFLLTLISHREIP